MRAYLEWRLGARAAGDAPSSALGAANTVRNVQRRGGGDRFSPATPNEQVPQRNLSAGWVYHQTVPMHVQGAGMTSATTREHTLTGRHLAEYVGTGVSTAVMQIGDWCGDGPAARA